MFESGRDGIRWVEIEKKPLTNGAVKWPSFVCRCLTGRFFYRLVSSEKIRDFECMSFILQWFFHSHQLIHESIYAYVPGYSLKSITNLKSNLFYEPTPFTCVSTKTNFCIINQSNPRSVDLTGCRCHANRTVFQWMTFLIHLRQ